MSDTKRLLDVLGNEGTLRGTDDVLAMTLPLLEQVLELHDRGMVAPLEGIEDVMVTDGRLWFTASKARAPKLAADKVEHLQRPQSLAFEVASHSKRVQDGAEQQTTDLDIVEPGEPLERPCYIARYVSWEHEVGHHDPLTDIYILGLVLASVALDQNLGDTSALSGFAAQRARLSSANERLHPVLTRAITRMTELVRHRRAQDLRAVIGTLKTYREQAVTLDSRQTVPAEDHGRRQVYGRLRERLFDFSRRNRLLYFSPSGQTVNLTLGSVPLMLDVKNVAPDALLTWTGRAAEDLTSANPVPLGRYLRFEDYPFLTSALDQLRLDAARSTTELGFSPLRLVVCFLHWHNLKENKDARITSPLVLLPVTLEKKKGVRDAVFLTSESAEAEVNPVLRQYFQQLYGVQLPETVDLGAEGALDALFADLVRQLQASEPGVSVTRLEKPRIDLVLAQAKKRLEAYRKRVALSGRSARSHRGFDCSYARSRLHPLGVQLFTQLVYPSPAPNRELHDDPRPRVFQHSPDVVEKSLYALKDGSTGGGPWEWALDLCNVTLANFNSKKMSLVRDYAGLMEFDASNASFDALFSSEARPVLEAPAPLPVEDRFEVMPADPTQASAIARARRGDSFIIQGPPGTGKSQTITNLLADAVARGKRVLFVCEKRAAIDVVFHRLQMQGLAPLTCLIHDSQTDKKAFIKDLKETYEGWIALSPSRALDDARRASAATFGSVLGRATRYRSAMQAVAPGGDLSILSLIDRALELQDLPGSNVPVERLPNHRNFTATAPIARSLEQALRAVGRASVFATHPLRTLADEVLFSEDPLSATRSESKHVLTTLDGLANSQLARAAGTPNLGQLAARMHLVERLKPLILQNALRLLDAVGQARSAFAALLSELDSLREVAAQAVSAAAGWRTLLPPDEATTALAQARRFESSWLYRLFGWLFPTWWRLRRVLHSSFDFASKAIHPAWTDVLEKLSARHGAEAALLTARQRGQKALGLTDLESVGQVLAELQPAQGELAAFEVWLGSPGAQSDAPALLRTVENAAGFDARLARLVRSHARYAPAELRGALAALESGLGDLPALLEPLRKLATPEHVAVADLVREYPISVDQLERDVCRATADLGLRERALDVLAGGDWDELRDHALRAGGELRRANAAAIVERARNAFLENVARSMAPADTLSSAQKKQKRQYAAGRKELEHEFSKTMRYRSIRDLATDNPGVVVRDLKPIWLMSPLSVADTLPLEALFDIVIFDEASQIPLEDAVPAAYRAAQTIVVGDEMQLPPTDFFGLGRSGDDEDTEVPGYELDAQSLLTHAARALPSTMLGWHYRSRDESLIAFSNRVFYEGQMLTVPSVTSAVRRPPIVVTAATDGAPGAAALLERAVSLHRLEHAPYEQRRNTGEARYIAELLRALLAQGTGKTIGVVAFSEAQQGEIETAIGELGEEDDAFAARYEAELEREEDGQHVGLFVKNLENVQGDERDIIIISVCYGPDARGKMLMNFGPINKAGGEKRLNVIFSRAKHHLAVVSSIRWPAITNEYNDGANCLRNYLRYAEAMSTGAVDEAQVALQTYGVRTTAHSSVPGALDHRLAQALRERGLEVDLGVGTSQFRCNLGVRRRGERRYRLGVLLDDAAHQARPVEEVVHSQASVLLGFGWKTLTVLHRDWYSNPELVLQRIDAALSFEG